jgi:hypothetical protein
MCDGSGVDLSDGCTVCAAPFGDSNGNVPGGSCSRTCDSDFFDIASSDPTNLTCVLEVGTLNGTITVTYSMTSCPDAAWTTEAANSICAGINTIGQTQTCDVSGSFATCNPTRRTISVQFNAAMNLSLSRSADDALTNQPDFQTPATTHLPAGSAHVSLGSADFAFTCATSGVDCTSGYANTMSSTLCTDCIQQCCLELGEGCFDLYPDGSCAVCAGNASAGVESSDCACDDGFVDIDSDASSLNCQPLGFGCATMTSNLTCTVCLDSNAQPSGHVCACKKNFVDSDANDNQLVCEAAQVSVKGEVSLQTNVTDCPRSNSVPSLTDYKTEAEKIVTSTLLELFPGLTSVSVLTATSTTCNNINKRRATPTRNLTLTVEINATGWPNTTQSIVGSSIAFPAYRDIPAQTRTVLLPNTAKPHSTDTPRERDGKIAGAVIGSIVGFVVLILLPIYCICFRGKSDNNNNNGGGKAKQPKKGSPEEPREEVEMGDAERDAEHRGGDKNFDV